jgi:hypothetical protein
MQTIDELAQLVQQRTWDKELVVWFGPESKLLPALTAVQVETLDLLDLFTTWPGLSETGTGVSEIRPHVGPVSQLTEDDDIRQYLTRSLRKWLQSLDRPGGKRTALLVRSAALLARYRVGVRDFYEWFCDDFSMVILLVERPAAEEQWPEEVECNPNRMVEYFSENDMTKRQFQA